MMRRAFRRVQLFGLNFSQMVQIGLKDVALQFQIGELAVPAYRDESRRLQLFHVMRERGRAHRLTAAHIRAGHCALSCANLPQDLVAARISQRLRNQMDLIR